MPLQHAWVELYLRLYNEDRRRRSIIMLTTDDINHLVFYLGQILNMIIYFTVYLIGSEASELLL